MSANKQPTGEQYADLLLSQEGDEYEWGVKPHPSDPDPEEGDCSGYTAWGANRLGVVPRFPHGSVVQWEHCRRHGTELPSIKDGIDTKGALLFRVNIRGQSNHVAVSLGNGKTIEAMGERYGVRQGNAYGRGWNHAALVPGMEYDGWEV